jgi:hypothetical protein
VKNDPEPEVYFVNMAARKRTHKADIMVVSAWPRISSAYFRARSLRAAGFCALAERELKMDYSLSSARSALASFKSMVSKPSVNQP